MRLYLHSDLEKAKLPSARAPKVPAVKDAAPKETDAKAPAPVQEKGAEAPKPETFGPKAKRPAARAPAQQQQTPEGDSDASTKPVGAKGKGDVTSKKQMVDCPLGQDDCRRNGGTGRHREGSPLLMKHQALMAKKGAAAGKAAGEPTEADVDGPIPEEQEKPIDSNSAPGQQQAQHEPVMSPESQATHGAHMQEYLSGSRDQEHHKMIHAMTVNEHRQTASKFRKNGNNDLAQLHEQAAVAKPRLKDISGAKAYENTPQGERKYNSSYLDSYITQANRYLNGGPGGHPSNKFSEVHGMSIAEHEDMANKLDSSGAKSAANRHKRIAAMKDTFDEKEKNMVSRRDMESQAKAEQKAAKANQGGTQAPQGDESPHGQVQTIGSNIMSHLTHNHNMDPSEKSELLKVAKHAKELHDKGDSSDKDVANLKQMAGRYGDAEYSGAKSKPGKHYLSQFSNDELEEHAQFAEASGDPDLAQHYRSASKRNTEAKNTADAKAASKQAKGDEKAAKASDRAGKKAESAEAKRVAAAPDLPADHGQYKAHAKNQADRLKDFLDGPAQLEDHERQSLESAHSVISAHSKLDSPATASQRRELRDATAVADKHMDNAKYKQLADNEQEKESNTSGHALASTFNKWWSHGSQIESASSDDRKAGELVNRVPHAVGSAIVHNTSNPLKGNTEERESTTSETEGKHDDFSPSKKKEEPVKKGLYLDLSKAVQIPNAGVDSPDDDRAAEEDDHISRKRLAGTGEGDTNKSLYDMSAVLKSMRNNLVSQMDKSVNSDSEHKFLVEKGFSSHEAKFNTDLLQKSFIRREYNNWLMEKLSKVLDKV